MPESVFTPTLPSRKPVAEPTAAEYLRVVALFVAIAIACFGVLLGLL
jgi:hypothetical protein